MYKYLEEENQTPPFSIHTTAHKDERGKHMSRNKYCICHPSLKNGIDGERNIDTPLHNTKGHNYYKLTDEVIA